jgi:WD40 repeat protein/tRNA A-37 threonylcarbamoyl transferase component Bud32
MTEQASCPDAVRWRELLDGTLPHRDQRALDAHLEACASCQQTLEELAADRRVWSGAARHLGQRRRDDEAGLLRVVADLEAAVGAAGTPTEPSLDRETSLDFLDPPEKPGQLGRLGPYEVLEVLGRGGMGVVLKAFDPKLHRVVAIKVLAPQTATNATARKRFVREAQAAAAVRDEHVINIYAVEEAHGLPYLVMEYISGMSLQDRLNGTGPLELKEILRIGIQTATGLAAAHAQGLIHRDITPANILLENGVQRVKITDFGLARAADDASLTQSGVVAGTPQYMAPEQARGEAVDHRADLFSLGSVLYALCTGRAPFRANGALAVLKRVSEETPRPIHEINAEVPDWLVEIIARLHAKDPAKRFPSAAMVAELLSQHLAQLQQHTLRLLPKRTDRVPPRVRKWRLTGGQLWTAAAAVLLLLAGSLGMTEATGVTRVTATVIRILTPEGTLLVETDDPAVTVTIEGDGGITITGAGPQEVRLRPGSYRFRATKDGVPIKDDMVTITRNQKEVVKVSVEGARPPFMPPGPLDRLDAAAIPAEERFAWQPPELVAVLGEHRQRHWDGVLSVAWSADGKWIASGGIDHVIRVWDAATMRERVVLRGHTRDVRSVVFSGDGRRILSGSWDATMRLWDAENGEELHRFEFHPQAGVDGVALFPDGLRALTASGDQLVRLWDVQTGKELCRLTGHTNASVKSVAFSPDGRRALSGGVDNTLRLWDLEGCKELNCFEGHTGQVSAAAFSPDGRCALSCNAHRYYPKEHADGPAAEYQLRLWDLETGKEVRRFVGHAHPVLGVAFSPDGRQALSCGDDATIRSWEVETGKELHRFEGHTGPVTCVAFSPDGRRAVSGSRDGTVRVWDPATGKEVRPLTGPTGVATTVTFAANGDILTAGWDGIVRLWSGAEGKEVRRFLGHTDPVASAALSPDGHRVLSASCVNHWFVPQPDNGDRTGPWRLWDADTRKELRHFEGPSTNYLASVAFSPDGKRALTSSRSQVLLWDVESGRLLRVLDGHTRGVTSVAFCSDGRRALSGGDDNKLRLWDLEGGTELRCFQGHTARIAARVALTPDDRQAASGSSDGTVRLWDLTSDQAQGRVFFKWHTNEVTSVAFGPDGKKLASSALDGRIILWDVATGDKIREWQLPGAVHDVALAPDGRHLAAANGNGTVYILRIGSRP